METHNRAPRGSEGLLCWKRTLEIARSFLFSNRNNAVIKCVCHHVLVTQVKLHCMEFFEVTVVLSSSHLLRQRTQKHAGKGDVSKDFCRKHLGKATSCTPHQSLQVPSFQKDGHPHWKTSSSPQRHGNPQIWNNRHSL